MIDPVEKILDRFWKKAEKGYYNDKPEYQFSKDYLNLMYYLGRMDEESYHIEKQRLEQMINGINEYNRCKHHYLFIL